MAGPQARSNMDSSVTLSVVRESCPNRSRRQRVGREPSRGTVARRCGFDSRAAHTRRSKPSAGGGSTREPTGTSTKRESVRASLRVRATGVQGSWLPPGDSLPADRGSTPHRTVGLASRYHCPRTPRGDSPARSSASGFASCVRQRLMLPGRRANAGPFGPVAQSAESAVRGEGYGYGTTKRNAGSTPARTIGLASRYHCPCVRWACIGPARQRRSDIRRDRRADYRARHLVAGSRR